MGVFEILAALITVAALFAWVNHRFIHLPNTIGVMLISLVISLVLVVIGQVRHEFIEPVRSLLESVDFDTTLLHGMLGALLFAGALHLNLNDLMGQRLVVAMLATAGVIISTILVGSAAWLLFGALDFPIDFMHCLLFGALISPTDPIAVGAILRKAGIPSSLYIKITGESLFNDGIGVVLFLGLLGFATGHGASAGHIAELLGLEVAGGIAFGFVIGWIAYLMLRSVDSYEVEILITLAIVTGGYALAHKLHVSGPLAMVVAGLLIGNRGRRLAMSDRTRTRLDEFWELVDEFLNAILFVLIGAEVIVIGFTGDYILAGVVAIPLILASRWISVSLPVMVLRRRRAFSPHVTKILTWAGLRGGISVALALSLPSGPERGLLVALTYFVVLFSILVQGLTVRRFVARLYRTTD